MTEPELEPTGRTPATPDAQGPGDAVDPTEAGLETGTEPDATDTDATEAAAAGDAVAEPNDETTAPAALAATATPAPESARRTPAAARSTARTQTPSDVAVHIDDRISAAFVLLVALAFAAILLYGLLGGRGGVLTQKSSPSPSPSPAASASASPSAPASGSAVVSPRAGVASSAATSASP